MQTIEKLRVFPKLSLIAGGLIFVLNAAMLSWNVSVAEPRRDRVAQTRSLDVERGAHSYRITDPAFYAQLREDKAALHKALSWDAFYLTILIAISGLGFGGWVVWHHLFVGKTPNEKKMRPGYGDVRLSILAIALTVAGLAFQLVSLEIGRA